MWKQICILSVNRQNLRVYRFAFTPFILMLSKGRVDGIKIDKGIFNKDQTQTPFHTNGKKLWCLKGVFRQVRGKKIPLKIKKIESDGLFHAWCGQNHHMKKVCQKYL